MQNIHNLQRNMIGLNIWHPCFKLSFRYKYDTLQELVVACKNNKQRGLACMLTNVCIRPRGPVNMLAKEGKWAIDRSELKKGRELGRGNFGIVYKGNDKVVMAQ